MIRMRSRIYMISDAVFWILGRFIHRRKPVIDKKNIKKILIIKYCSIGDILMTTTFIRETRINFPDTRIDYYVGEWSAAVLYGNKDIDNIYINKKSTYKKMKAQFKKEKYDIVFTLDPGIGDVYFGYTLRPKVLIGQDAYYRGFLLNYKVPHSVHDGLHERELYLNMLRVIGINVTTKKMYLTLEEKDLKFAEAFIRKNRLEHKRIIGIFPGGGSNPWGKTNLKQWIEEHHAQLCDNLIDKNFTVIFFGAKSDLAVIDLIKKNMRNFPQAINLCGKLEIRQSAAIIKMCDVLVTNDSSLMHVAAAVGTKTVDIFGPTEPKLLKPYGDEHIALYTQKRCVPDYSITDKNFNCHPCYRQIIGNFKYDCQTKQCMHFISVKDVESKIMSLLRL